MKRRCRKSKHTIRSIGTLLLLLITLILPLIGSAQRTVPLICLKTKRASEHDCAHCTATKGLPNVTGKPNENTVSRAVSDAKEASVQKGGESCCQPQKTSQEQSQASKSKPRAKEIASSAVACKCEMAPAETRPISKGHITTGVTFEPLAPAAEISLPDESAEPVDTQVFARVTRGPPPYVFRLGPPDRAPPAI